MLQQSQHQVEVRNITKKISDLNCKLDTVSTLSEPRENSYIEYRLSCSSDDADHVVDPVLGGIAVNLAQLGSIKVYCYKKIKNNPSLSHIKTGWI